MTRHKYKEPQVGGIFGKWKVMGYSHYDNEHYWVVICLGCNKEYSRRAGQLCLGRSRGCQSCNAFEREKYSFWEGLEGMSVQYLTRLKFRGKVVEVTLQDLLDKWKEQKGICVYSGVPLRLVEKDSGWINSTASLDRIDSDIGYIKGNIQWVHKRINIMKSDMSHGEFQLWCKLVYERGGGSCGV